MKRLGAISFLEHQGSGPCIVFLHGIGSNAGSFSPVFNALPKRFRMIAWNAPGYLESKPLEEPEPRPHHYARALEHFLDAANVNRTSIVGHSLGTLIAAEFAKMFPERVEALVLVSAANGYGMQTGDVLPTKAAARLSDLNSLGPNRFAQSRAANLVHKPAENPELVAVIEAGMAQINPAGYAQAVHMLAAGDLKLTMADVPVRPGFIVGQEDKITPVDQTYTASRAWEIAHGSKPEVTAIRDAGHAVYAQKTQTFVDALLRHLENAGVDCQREKTEGEGHVW